MAALVAGLATAVAVTPGWASASPTVTGVVVAATDPVVTDPVVVAATDPVVTDPETDPTDATPTVEPTTTEPAPTTAPPTESAPPETTPPPPPTTEPAPTTTAPAPVPTTTAPTTTAPAPPPAPVPPVVAPPAPPGAGGPAPGQLGVRVTTEDISLTPAYWNARSTVTTLRVTVTNTGSTPELLRLGYRLPAGLTDAGTAGCAYAGGRSYRCGQWTAAPGARFSSSIRVRVSGDAWRSMPLSGSVRVTATAPGVTGSAADDEGFAVLFPPGPPVPGISLRADEVVFDISGAPSALSVRLGNTGTVDAAGRIEVVLPDGVTVSTPPAGCVGMPGRTRCDVGTVAAGRSVTLGLPLTATHEAQRRAPLAGAVIGRLDPRSGRSRQVQMSFRITAAAALATPPIGTPAPTGSQGVLAVAGQAADDDLDSVQQTAITLIAVSGVLVVLALALATASLRRRMTDPAPDPGTAPTGTE